MMRPDEKANLSEIERDQQLRRNIGKGVSAIGTLGTAGLGAGLAAKITPFLSQHIPVDLAIKGINKISPKLGQFLKRGQSMGLDIEEGIEYIKGQMKPKEDSPEQNPFSFLARYSPQLAQIIRTHIQGGRSPKEAAALAYTTGKFNKEIQNIQKDTKENFEDYLERLFMNAKGNSEDSGMMQQQGQPQQGQPQQQQGGQGQQALMAILQKLQQTRGQ